MGVRQSKWPLVLLGSTVACLGEVESLAAPAETSDTGDPSDPDPSHPGPSGVGFPTDPLEYPIDAMGPFRVGYRVLTLTYDLDVIAMTRTIPVHVWYPTNDTIGTHPDYEAGPMDETSLLDASLAPSAYSDGLYPVHIFSHGRLGIGPNAFPLMAALASHGWVGVAPDHLGDAFGDAFISEPAPLWKYYARMFDISATLDYLEQLPDADPLHGQLTTDPVVMSGHSTGTFTTWAISGATLDAQFIELLCSNDIIADCTPEELELIGTSFRDPRVVAAIPMAGVLNQNWFGDGYVNASIPMLAMSGSDDSMTDAAGQFDYVDGLNFTWIDIEGGCHELFIYGGCANITNEVGFPIVATYARAFARSHVFRDNDPTVLGLLDGSIELSTLVSFAQK